MREKIGRGSATRSRLFAHATYRISFSPFFKFKSLRSGALNNINKKFYSSPVKNYWKITQMY